MITAISLAAAVTAIFLTGIMLVLAVLVFRGKDISDYFYDESLVKKPELNPYEEDKY